MRYSESGSIQWEVVSESILLFDLICDTSLACLVRVTYVGFLLELGKSILNYIWRNNFPKMGMMILKK